MAERGFPELEKGVKGGLEPLYYLWGKDPFPLSQAEALILQKALPDPKGGAFIFSGEEGKAILQELKTLPFFSPRKVVIVRDARPFLREHEGLLLEYLKTPNPKAILVLESPDPPPEALTPWGYCLQGGAREFFFWLNRMARGRGLVLTRRAAALLKELYADDLLSLDQELEKLYLYKGRGPVDLGDLEEVLADFRLQSAFELVKALEKGDTKEALKILDRLYQQGEPSPKILGAIAWKLREELKKREDIRLLEVIKGLYRLDYEAKKRGTSSRFLLEGLLFSLPVKPSEGSAPAG